MENIIKKSTMNHHILRLMGYVRLNHTKPKPEFPTKKKNIMDKIKKSHPYRSIHPWKSKNDFCESMLKQVIYDKDGLVAINKPYGISGRSFGFEEQAKEKAISGIFNEKKYVLTDALPLIAKQLGYESLVIAKTPEKYTSGVTLLSASDSITKAIEKSMRRAEGQRIIPRTYWTVTRRMPIFPEGERRVAMKLMEGPEKGVKEVVIVTKWSNNERARGDIKILNVQFRVLSTASYNLASLMEIKASTSQWHSVRLFAATVTMSPILGDRYYGSRIQDVMGKFLTISPFVEAAHEIPRLDKELLEIIKMTQKKSIMIPTHIHLREFFLPWYRTKGNDIAITAPPQPEFLWTCKRLRFKEELFLPVDNERDSTSNNNLVESNNDNNMEQHDSEQCLAIT